VLQLTVLAGRKRHLKAIARVLKFPLKLVGIGFVLFSGAGYPRRVALSAARPAGDRPPGG